MVKGPPLKAHGLAVFEALVKHVTSNCSAGTVIFDVEAGFSRLAQLKPQSEYSLKFLFFGCSLDEVTTWLHGLNCHLADPQHNFQLVTCSLPESRRSTQLAVAIAVPPTEVCLEFLTPLPFRSDKRRTFLDEPQFIELIERRVQRLFGRAPDLRSPALSFRLLPYYWEYRQVSRLSHSQPGTTQYLKGCLGKLYLKGDIAPLLPWLALCEEIHLGGQFAFGMGRYRLHLNSYPSSRRDSRHETNFTAAWSWYWTASMMPRRCSPARAASRSIRWRS